MTVEHPFRSPMFNFPDAVWNLGESAIQTDAGGILTPPVVGPMIPGTHFHPYLGPSYPNNGPTGGWHPLVNVGATDAFRGIAPINAQHFVGYMRDGAIANPQDKVLDGGFEILVSDYDPTLSKTVIVIRSWATNLFGFKNPGDGVPPDIGERAVSGGWEHHNGVTSGPPSVPLEILQRNGASGRPAKTHNVIYARIWPRNVGKPAVSQMQRNVELVRAVRAMWADNNPFWRPANWPQATGFLPCLFVGSSFGGAVANWSVLFYPEDFQAAMSGSGVPSIRRYVGEQNMSDYLMALSGFSASGRAWENIDALMYPTALWHPGNLHAVPGWSPFFHASVLRAWRDGVLRRPTYQVVHDEDSVSTGTDWVPIISGVRQFLSNGVGYPPAGQDQIPMYWSWASKRCHEFAESTSPLGNVWNTGSDYVLDFLAAIQNEPSFLSAEVFTPPVTAENATEDPYDHALQPAGVPSGVLSPSPSPAWLRLDPDFSSAALAGLPAGAKRPGKSFGFGTYLGFKDSMITGAPYQSVPGEPGIIKEVFVGSAEGVVTRLVVGASGEVVPHAMSPALGFGAWGIVPAEINGGYPGKEIIVSTWRGLHVLSRFDLSVISSRTDLPWEFARCKHLQVCDVIPGGSGRSEIVAISEHGSLGIFDSVTLQELFVYGEPGVIDMKVLKSVGNPMRIAILSERGHVAKLAIDMTAQPAPTVTLEAVSPRLNGIGIDMEFFDIESAIPGPELAVLMGGTVNSHDEGIWVLDTLTLLPIQFLDTLNHNLNGPLQSHYGRSADLEVVDDDGQIKFVVLDNDQIAVAGMFPTDGLALMSFPPLMRALDIVVDDITADSPGLEVLVASETGYVSWFPLADLTTAPLPAEQLAAIAGGRSLPFTSTLLTANNKASWPRPPGSTDTPHEHCCRTLAATWGMTLGPATWDPASSTPPTSIELLDQSGSRWSVDGVGHVTFVNSVGWRPLAGPVVMPRPGPYRAMRRFPGLTSAGSLDPRALVLGLPGSSQPLASGSTAPALPWLAFESQLTSSHLRTSPYVPIGVGDPLISTALAQLPIGHWNSFQSGESAYLLQIHDGFAAIPKGGDSLTLSSGARYLCWWSGQGGPVGGTWGNRIQGIKADGNSITSWWTSTGGVAPQLQTQPPLIPLAGAPLVGLDLRSVVGGLAMHNAQALDLFEEPGTGALRIALFTPGARLMILSPGTGPTDTGSILAEGTAMDYGTGGMALATHVHDPQTGPVDLYVGSVAGFGDTTQFDAANPTGADDMVSTLGHVVWDGQSPSITPPIHLDGSQGLPKVYGVCGIAVGELIDVPGDPSLEIVVTSMDGHLLVFKRNGDGSFGTLLHHEEVDGAIGMYNSIVLADLADHSGPAPVVGQDGKNELYVAGSLGLRKWIP